MKFVYYNDNKGKIKVKTGKGEKKVKITHKKWYQFWK